MRKPGDCWPHGWLVPVQREAYFSEVRQTFRYPEEGAVIYDVYTHPLARGRGLFHACLTEMLFDVARKEKVGHAYCSVLATNAPSRHVVEKLGFRHFCSLNYSRLLWRTRKSAVPVAAAV